MLNPSTPMIFMGEEWGTTPAFPLFLRFRSRSCRNMVREGRIKPISP